MFSESTLLAAGASGAGGDQSIGEAGGQGFGVGVYGGDSADLDAMGLTPMDGCDDVSSDNYGNYVHDDGSVMVFIPAFCYRIGNAAAPNYSIYGANSLEIRDAALGEGDGWVLHRAFIDGGQQKLGFFIDKYLCSKSSDGKTAVSVKNGNPICLSSSYINSSSMPNCSGRIGDAIVLSRARGDAYSCVTWAQWSAIAMLAHAHGEAASSTAFCAWYDSTHTTNFPKGNNNNSYGDTNDSSVKFTSASGNAGTTCLTGSGTPFAKTTHNGQASGITDINGNKFQPLLGVHQYNGIYVVKESVRVHDLTYENAGASKVDSLYDFTSTNVPNGSGSDSGWRFGNGSSGVFHTEASGVQRAVNGLFPKKGGNSSSGTAMFGNDYGYYYSNKAFCVLASGNCDNSSGAGVWYRDGHDSSWRSGSSNVGFRAAGYAN